MILILFILIHLIISVVVFVLQDMNILKIRDRIYPIVYLVPYVGFMMLLVECIMDKRNRIGQREIDLDKLEITQVRYKQIKVPQKEENEVVPLEEAMAINDSKVRRSLILDILRKNPENYVAVLEKASLSSDTELSHYATTSMMAIQSRYEKSIAELEKEKERDKDNPIVLDDYATVLKNYINSGLISGQVLRIYQNKLNKVLEELKGLCPEKIKYRFDWIDNRLDIGNTAGVKAECEDLLKKWPGEERCYKSYMAYAFKISDKKLAMQILKEVKEKEVYLSRAGREWYDFWNAESKGEELYGRSSGTNPKI